MKVVPEDIQPFDPREIIPRLRSDLIVAPRRVGQTGIYVIEDPLTGKYYRVGKAEFSVAARMDGRRNLYEISRLSETGDPMVSRQDTLRIYHWLLQNGLAQRVGSDDPATQPSRREGSRRNWINPIFVRIPVLAPDKWFERLLPRLGWLHSPVAMLGALVLGILAIGHVVAGWERFIDSATNVISLERGCYLLLGWIVLKFAHELSHGLACKHYGAFVREAGIGLLLFAPVPYVDVTSSWRIRSKWARIHIAAAGIYAEMILGALAVFLWHHTDNLVLAQFCVHMAAMATVTTVAFNANPLSRFDGYYVLADWLEIPNLYSQGQQYVSSLAKRWLLGEKTAVHPSAPWPVRVYGLLSFVWRIVVCASITCAAAMLWQGAGIVVAAFAIGAWFLAPLHRSASYAWRSAGWRGLARCTAILGWAGTTLAIAASVIPWPAARCSPGIVEFDPYSAVRAASPGFVREVDCVAGQYVQAGDKIAVLENDQLADELKVLGLSLQASQLRCRLHRQRGEMAACQAEEERAAALQKQLAEKQVEVTSLVVTAPCEGKILARNLDSLVGTYCRQGQELCRLGFDNRKEIQILIHQDDVESFRNRAGQTLVVRSPQGQFQAQLSSLSPRADDQVVHAALCAPYGGPLPVQTDRKPASSDMYHLLEPRVLGRLRLDPPQSLGLRSGQLCTVLACSPEDTVGSVVLAKVRRWFAAKLTP